MKERRFKKMPIVVKATQWFKNGDHPEDDVFRPFEDTGKIPDKPREGAVVGYYSSAFSPGGQDMCSRCGELMYTHGQLRAPEGNHVVCPGDWIITDLKGERHPCKPDIFEASYEEVEEGVEPESPEPPPVEIPRRVMWYEPGEEMHGDLGTIIRKEYGNRYYVRWDSPEGESEQLSFPVNEEEGYVQELKLSKTEQARLLLEKLSREAWEGLDFPTANSLYYVGYIDVEGLPRSFVFTDLPFGTPTFPDKGVAESARDIIIRAGLAWWEEGE